MEGMPFVQDGVVGHLKGDNLNSIYLLGPVDGLDDLADWDFESAPTLSGYTEGVRVGINGEYDVFWENAAAFSLGELEMTTLPYIRTGATAASSVASSFLGGTKMGMTFGTRDVQMAIYWRNRLLWRTMLPESLGLEMAGYFQAALPRGLAVRFKTETKGPRPPTSKDMVDEDNWMETIFKFALTIIDFFADIPDEWTLTDDRE